MLVVLAVFSMLTLLFVVTSQQAMVKTRAARVANDERVISDQIHFYASISGTIPSDNQGLNRAFNPYRPGDQVPIDPFSRNTQLREPYAYYSNLSPKHSFVIISRGPDGQLDLAPILEQKKSQGGNLSGDSRNGTLMSAAEAEEYIIKNSYDPTNGTMSAGDIIRVQRD
ncbi:type II secretion system GspH family protein [bacterium]|nr:type II secretion system GspH family protein [bacterium]